MKMAKASEADLQMAMDLSNALESLERCRYFPQAMAGPDADDGERFDEDDAEDCKRALGYLLGLSARASLSRVVFGMAIVCDPRNEVVDPDADTLEAHPKVAAAEKNAERYCWLRDTSTSTWPSFQDQWRMTADQCDATIDSQMKTSVNFASA